MKVRAKLDYKKLRDEMVEKAIFARGVRSEPVLDAMRSVPRESFLPSQLREFAYDDAPLPIEEGQTISQPYIVAFMTEALALRGGEKVLEIGTGSGYAAAVLLKSLRTSTPLSATVRWPRRRPRRWPISVTIISMFCTVTERAVGQRMHPMTPLLSRLEGHRFPNL
jgi:hypothetical protein